MKPTNAVVWSGLWNFIGVHAGGIGVAYGIVHLLPVDLLVDIKTGRGLALVISPAIGFGLAALLLMLTRRLLPSQRLHEPPPATSRRGAGSGSS